MNNKYFLFTNIFCCLFLFVSCGQTSEPYQFYISRDGDDNNPGTSIGNPLASMEKAVALISSKSKEYPNSSFEIIIKGGRYELNRPIKLSSDDFNKGKVHFKAFNNENVVLSGGKEISGQWIAIGENLWSTPVKESFKQLFQGEDRLTRARWPNEERYLHPAALDVKQKWMDFSDSIPLNFKIDENMELVTTGQWHFIRQRIASLDKEKNRITTVTEIGPECSSRKVALHDRVYFENNREFLDTEGEWYLDVRSNTLFLYSKSDPNSRNYYYPTMETLFFLEGNRENPIKDITLEGITFQHATWGYSMNERKGIQAGYWGTEIGKPVYSPPAAIMFRYAENCEITNCTFRNLGEGAIAFEEGSHNNTVQNNTFSDIGSNVIQVARISDFVGRGHPLHYDYEDEEIAPSNHRIVDNHFKNGASVDNGGVAIMVGYAHHSLIKNNLIEDFPYCAISVGWRWGNDGKLTNTHNNDVAFNEIRRCMQYLSDGGAIYTVGNQPGTKIVNNWMYDIRGGEMLVEGIFNDEGSGSMVVANNYVNDIQEYDYKGHMNLWNTMVIKNNGCHDTCENKLQILNERVKYSDFPNNRPEDTSLYGIQK